MNISDSIGRIQKMDTSDLKFEKKAIPALFVFFVLITIGIGLFFFWRSTNKKDEEDKVIVATTIFPIYDLAQNVIGDDDVELIQLIPSGASPHTFEPTPQDQEKISEADIIFRIGAGFDDWIDTLIQDSDVRIIDLSQSVDLLTSTEAEVLSTNIQDEEISNFCTENGGEWLPDHLECTGISEDNCTQEGGSFDSCASSCRHDSGTDSCIQVCVQVCSFSNIITEAETHQSNSYDPHYWLSVENAKIITAVMYQELSVLRPGMQDTYYVNGDLYLQSLEELKVYIEEKSSDVSDKRLITFHNSFSYFANEYDFIVAASFEEIPGQEPTPQYLAEINNIVKETDIHVMYKEPQMSEESIKAFAEDLGIEIRTLDPLGGGEETLSYVDLMRFNIDQIAGDL